MLALDGSAAAGATLDPGRAPGGVGARLGDPVQTDASSAGRTRDGRAVGLDPGAVVRLLERMAASLGALEAGLPQLGSRVAPRGDEGPAVRWLEDEELAAKLQRVLRRQAADRGIDLQ